MSLRNQAHILCACLLLLVSESQAAAVLESVPSNPLIAVLKMISALCVVLVFLWLFLRLMRRLHSPQGARDSGLDIVSSFPLGQRDKLVIVQVGEEQLLLGVSAAGINHLHTLPAAIEPGQGVVTPEFSKTLSAAIKRVVPQ